MSFPSSISWNCENCDHICSDQIPSKIWDSIDHTSPLVGSVKPYDKHWLTFLSTPWPSDIKNASNSSIPKLLTYLKSLPNKSIVSASASSSLKANELFVFPDFKKIHINQDDLEMQIDRYISREDEASILPGSAYILVCMHQERDARCGSIGPLIIEAFQSMIESKGLVDQVFVFGISHVGGHKFAGNCIIYHSNPLLSGHWYGRVTPDNAKQLFESHIIKGQVMQKLWRGSGKQF